MPLEIRRIAYGTAAATALLDEMNVEMDALYAGARDTRDPLMGELVEFALTIHPNEMVAAVGAFDAGELVAHAALRPFEDALEVKRVFVRAAHRGHGVSKLLMSELEAIARERGVTSLVLQTGNRQHEAIALYSKIGYLPIERFGAYAPVPFFLCYGKTLMP